MKSRKLTPTARTKLTTASSAGFDSKARQMNRAVRISRALSEAVDRLTFAPPVTHVYNPLAYARRSHEKYLASYARPGVDALLVGMNPGPWGMAQTGVPFGEIRAVRDWMGIEATVSRPDPEHPKRPVEGFACRRSEVSGARLWGWAETRYTSPEAFFSRFFVHNYCPLCFMEASGRNFTPDKLPAGEKERLFHCCDDALAAIIDFLKPRYAIGVGAFAEARIRTITRDTEIVTGRILHPSPASPAANRGWSQAAEKNLRDLGIEL